MNVKELMIPLSQCPQIAKDRSLQEAMTMLNAFRQRYSHSDYLPRFVLVRDDQYRIVGVLRHLEILRSLGKEIGTGELSLIAMGAVASRVAARDAMTAYGEAEHIQADTPVGEAIGRMLEGSYRHLLVFEGQTTIGILRLSDIFGRMLKK